MHAPDPFLRVEAYSLEPSRPALAGHRKWSLSDSIAEVTRTPGHCDHVEQPLRPRLLTTVSPTALLETARERAAAARDPLGRRIRADGVVAASYVASYPEPWDRVRSSWAAKRRYLRWRKRAIAFLLRELGADASILEHRDEAYPHLHGYGVADLVPGVTKAGQPVLFLDIGPVDPGRRARNAVRRAGGNKEAQNEAAAAAYRDLHHRFARDVGLEAGFAVPGLEGPGRKRVDAPTYRAGREARAENTRLRERITELEGELLRADRLLVGEAALAWRNRGNAQELPQGSGGDAKLVARAVQSRMGDHAALERLEPDGTVVLLAPGTPGGGRIGRGLLRTVEEARGDGAAISRLSGEVLKLRAANEVAEARLAAAERAATEAALAADAKNDVLIAEVSRRDALTAAEKQRSQQLSKQVGALQRVGEGFRNALGRIAAADGPEGLARALDPVAPPAAALVRNLMARIAQLAGRPTREELDAAIAERDEAVRQARATKEETCAAEERAKAAREMADEARRDLVQLQHRLREASDRAERETTARSHAEKRTEQAEEARRVAEDRAARLEATKAQQLADAHAAGHALGHAAGQQVGRDAAAAALRQELGRLEITAGAEPIADATKAIKDSRAAAARAEERARKAEVTAGAKAAPTETPEAGHRRRGLDGLIVQMREAATGVVRAAEELQRQGPTLCARITALAAGAGRTVYETAALAAPDYQASCRKVPDTFRAARDLDQACADLNRLSQTLDQEARALGGFNASNRAEFQKTRHELLERIAWIPPSAPGARAPWEVVSEALSPARAPGSSEVLRAASPIPEVESAAERDHRLRHQTRELYAGTPGSSAQLQPARI